MPASHGFLTSVDICHVVDSAARESYGRLLAYVASRCQDLAEAEDALGAAFLAALETWPRSGVPVNPDAWLVSVARRRHLDRAKHQMVAERALESLATEMCGPPGEETFDFDFPDERLKLLFVCAHPAIEAAARTPLMLQTVLGMSADRIASAFLVKPATMSARLTRWKARIRAARVAYEIPDEAELPARLDSVLQAIYAAYGFGWENDHGADSGQPGLAHEALFLGRLVAKLLPDQPEAWGLLALMLHCEARRGARRDAAGRYVPLKQQPMAQWDELLIEEAETALRRAAQAKELGRFQLEAAIQSVHNHRRITGETAWEAVALLYEGLSKLAPTLGILVGRAAALAEARGPELAWQQLQEIPIESVAQYQPYWAVRGHVLQQLQRHEEASQAFVRAMGLCEDFATRQYLWTAARQLR